MTSIASKASYKRLKQEVIFEKDIEEEDHHHHRRSLEIQNKSKKESIIDVIKRSSSSVRLRSKNLVSWLKFRRRFRIKFGGNYFRRFFKIRRKNKLKVARLSWANKVYKRLKESQSHFGDLFAGNYLFMQVTPASFNNNNNNKNKICVSSSHSYLYNHSNYKLPASLIPSTYNITPKNYVLEKVV